MKNTLQLKIKQFLEFIKKVNWRKRAPLIVFLLVSLIAGIFVFTAVKNITSSWSITKIEGIAIQPTATPEIGVSENLLVGGSNVEEMPDVRFGTWDKSSRVNILVMGLDSRDWEAGVDYPRSDTMILVTLDPASMTAAMLSIPRDLWVDIPGFGYAKINTAYYNGEAAKLPGGGPELAMKTVEDFLGIKVHYYAQIDFNTLVQFIDFLDGIRIDVPENLKLTTVIGSDKPLYLKKGDHVTLNGQEVLAYVRYRHSGGGDFGRSRRQQLIMLAIRDKLVEPYWQARILANAPQIYEIFSQGIRTNMTFDEIMQLGLLAKDIQVENIRQGAITPPDMVTLEKSPDGLDILKPITANIRKLRDEIFTTGNAVGPKASTMYDQATLLAQENASVAVYNGSSVSGLAGTTEQYLKSQGINVTLTGNGDLVNATTITMYGAKPYTLKYLVETLNINALYIKYTHDPAKGVDIEVIVGNDWTVPQ
jgi:LCP family protein required for cell wall assembly